MDLISNAIAKLKNAVLVEKTEVSLPKNKVVLSIVRVMKEEGFVADFTEEEKELVVKLAYDDGKSKIADIKRVSSGGQRTYVSAVELRPVYGGRGIGIISTSQGVMTAEEAKEKNLGGEYICKIW